MNNLTDNDTREGGRLKSPHVSPTLEHIGGDGIGEPGPPDSVACRDCPVSIWYWRGSHRLFCFCSAMHDQTWGGDEEPIQFCDAREQEVAKLLTKLASASTAPAGIEG